MATSTEDGDERLRRELSKAIQQLQGLVATSHETQEEIRAFKDDRVAQAEGTPLAPASLRRMREGTRAYVVLQERLGAMAGHFQEVGERKSSSEHGKALRLAATSLSLAASVTLYDNYLSLLTILRDPRLRRLVNDPDVGYGIEEDALWRIVDGMNSDETRARLHRLVRRWASATTDVPEGLYPQLDLLRMTIESSVSYRYAKAEILKRHLLTQSDIWTAKLVDTLDRLGQSALSTLSEIFGNGIGLVEIRKGKLYADEGVRHEVLDALRPLDLLLEKTPFRLTDFFIPGYFGHVAIWAGDEKELDALDLWGLPGMDTKRMRACRKKVGAGRSVIEALRTGVTQSTLAHFLNVDDLLVLRPIYLHEDEIRPTLVKAFNQVGKAYDFSFDVETTGAIVCSELPYHVYPRMTWDTESQLGRFTITPDNIASKALGPNAPFEIVLLYEDGKRIEAEEAAPRLAGLLGRTALDHTPDSSYK